MLPLDIFVEIGRHCTDTFDYSSVLNLSLTCQAVRSVLKPTLQEVIFWTHENHSGFQFHKLCSSDDAVPDTWKHVK